MDLTARTLLADIGVLSACGGLGYFNLMGLYYNDIGPQNIYGAFQGCQTSNGGLPKIQSQKQLEAIRLLSSEID